MLRMMGGTPDGHEHDQMDAHASVPTREDGPMDQDRARSLLIAERDEVQGLLKDAEAAGQEDRQAEVDSEAEDQEDAIERALHRLDDGTYGRSVRSGKPIPDERLEADPAAELTIEEARAAERR
jgi:DnaK suppressor protein